MATFAVKLGTNEASERIFLGHGGPTLSLRERVVFDSYDAAADSAASWGGEVVSAGPLLGEQP